MKKTKILLTILLCAIISLSACVTAFATNSNPAITVSNVTAAEGESVTIDIDISNNPGIMAMAFCITYDTDALTYKNYTKGCLSNYTVYPHEDKGYISFVNVENKDVKKDGTILSLSFDVKKDAKAGKHIIALANSNIEKHGSKLHNSFSNSSQQFILPIAASGGVTVPETCENSGHKYGPWEIIKEANCTKTGLREHACIRCDEKEESIIPITHIFEEDWTIDKPATPTEDGIMSRHCTKCDEVTDKITFSYEEIGDDNENTSSNESSSSADSSASDVSSSTASDTSSQTTSSNTTENNKPNIENVVGEKVPLQEAEKFNDYQQIIKPSLENDLTSSKENISSELLSNDLTSSENVVDKSDTTTDEIENNDFDNAQKDPSFFDTTSGIATIVICALLTVGIIALGILLIIRNKK